MSGRTSTPHPETARRDARTGARAQAVAPALEAARSRSILPLFIGEAELYREAPDCSLREVTVVIKEHDGPTTPARLACPACRGPLKVHHVLTLDEARATAELEARLSVNVQLYRRRQRHLGLDADAVPLRAVLDDSLPDVVECPRCGRTDAGRLDAPPSTARPSE